MGQNSTSAQNRIQIDLNQIIPTCRCGSGSDAAAAGQLTTRSATTNATAIAPRTPAVSIRNRGVPSASAILIARGLPAPQRPVLFAYDRGATMPGLAAPARRVGLFFGDTTAATLNASGWKFFDAAVKWAVAR